MPQEELEILKQIFETIGIEIVVCGELPKEKKVAELFVNISREAVTNAVRHGFATQVHIDMETTISSSHLCIYDNGYLPSGEIKEGGGIGGMREKLRAYAGTLDIDLAERFTIRASVPIKEAINE
jgi:signal transduction histidine kinase